VNYTRFCENDDSLTLMDNQDSFIKVNLTAIRFWLCLYIPTW